ncbi:MAG TPA: phosphate ABC transporter substrate-binding protein PstS [Thermoanaerobaculia bacterium]|jgi:phosphate transport system substrate-binding protein|nr:phosphate ABC transporter substrate-binding protein PstS [Thermoanaerobaculia bacterium]
MMRFFRLIAAAALAVAFARPGAAETIRINGAGATFPYPIYSKWFSEYNKLHPDVEINYQSIGSGGGIRQLTNRTVFFGATDGPMTKEQMLSTPGRILHLPAVLGADVPVYNIPGVDVELKFTGPLLADIFLGKITKWNDPAIAKLNPGVKLPPTDIVVAHRSDGSGTTYIWVDYLSKVSPEWKKQVGVATSVNWPVGIGGKGNEGVAGLVKQTPGAIGYVELIYAIQNKIPYGTVQNTSGEFVRASLESVTKAAAATKGKMPPDFRVSITNAPGAGVYPISSFTWLLFYENPKDKRAARVMTDFMRWALHDGQKYCADLGYAPLPEEVVAMEMEALKKIRL